MSIIAHIQTLSKYIPQYNIKNPVISQASVGRHIHHSLIVIRDIMQSVMKSDPTQYKWTYNLTRYLVLTTGWIPRGKAKAPESTLPTQETNIENIEALINDIQQIAPIFESGTYTRHYFAHPFFGHLTCTQAKRNIAVHTNHHLKIIKDITNSS